MDKFSRISVNAFVRAFTLSSAAGLSMLALATTPAAADGPHIDVHGAITADAAQAGTRASADATTTHTKDAVDIFHYSMQGGNPGAGQVAAFAPNLNFATNLKPQERFEAFNSYAADKRLVTKAVPIQPVYSSYQVAVWGTGYYDTERFRGTFAGADFDRRTHSGGGLLGVDVLKRGLTSGADALLIGVMGGIGETHVRNIDGSTTRLSAPGVGVYGAYINGGFSVDGLVKADFVGEDDTPAGGPVTSRRLNNYVIAGNVNYKMFMPMGWWWEPTVGVLHIISVWGNAEHLAGFQDGTVTRVQGGVRAGWQTMWGTVQVQPTFGVYVFSDVAVRGGTQLGAAPTPNDEGKVWGKGTAKLNFVATKVFSIYVEAEVRGTSDIIGGAGRVGGRVTF